MNAKAIFSISKVMMMGFVILVSACSPLVVVQPVQVPSATDAPVILPSPTLEPTDMPTVQPTVVATNLPTETSAPVSTQCQDAAQYVGDDGLDGTVYPPNTAFTKTWRIKNTGSCTWDSSYLVYQVSGTFMTQSPGYYIVPQGQTVAPGQTVDVSVGMTSPVADGSYRSDWGLKKPNGQFIPVQGGANGNSFYVKLKVSRGDVNVSGSIGIELEQGSGDACTPNSTYFVNATITADGATTVSYEIASTAGQIPAGNFMQGYTGPESPVEYGNLVFDEAGTQKVIYRFVGPYPYPDNITVTLRVNDGEWQTAKLSCP
jgi:hypothetical protein